MQLYEIGSLKNQSVGDLCCTTTMKLTHKKTQTALLHMY